MDDLRGGGALGREHRDGHVSRSAQSPEGDAAQGVQGFHPDFQSQSSLHPSPQNGKWDPCQKAGSVLKSCGWHLPSWHGPAATFGWAGGWTDDFSEGQTISFAQTEKVLRPNLEANAAFNGRHSLRPGAHRALFKPAPPWAKQRLKASIDPNAPGGNANRCASSTGAPFKAANQNGEEGKW